MTEKFSVKTRYVWFTYADWQVFSDALAEAYPQARYDMRPSHTVGPARPEPLWENRFMDMPLTQWGPENWAGQHAMVFDPHWLPRYKTYRLNDDPPDTIRWGGDNSTPLPFVKFGPCTAPTADELATITTFEHSQINYFCAGDDKPAAAHMRRFFRLLDKLCTNRNQAHYRLPSFELSSIEARGSWFWFGHDAIRWVREDPRRTFRYMVKDSGIRPVTEEEMVQLKAQLTPPQSE